MNRVTIFFLVIISPLLAIGLAFLGWKTLPANWMGCFLILAGLVYFFGVLIVYWLRGRKFWLQPDGSKQVVEEKGDRSFWLIAPGMFIPFVISPLEFLYFPTWIPDSILQQIAGLSLEVLGGVLFIWARRTLKSAYSGHLTVTETQTLVQVGPYQFIRHPAYASFILMTLGIGLGYSSLIGLLAVPFLVIPGLVFRIRVEDRLLAQSFGQQFQDYSRRIARLIPGIW